MIAVRQAGADDDGEVAALVRAAFAPVAFRFGLDAVNCPTHPSLTATETIRTSRERGTRFLLLTDDGRLMGSAGLRRPADGVSAIEKLAVSPSCQRRGFGTLLLDRIADLAVADGADRLRAAIIADHVELEAWYVRRGFSPTRFDHYDRLPFAVRILERRLG